MESGWGCDLRDIENQTILTFYCVLGKKFLDIYNHVILLTQYFLDRLIAIAGLINNLTQSLQFFKVVLQMFGCKEISSFHQKLK